MEQLGSLRQWLGFVNSTVNEFFHSTGTVLLVAW